ncbi:NADH kinase pos5 [Naganishia albida]|nr:NADH kinase pos5 [Naganishia albida]
MHRRPLSHLWPPPPFTTRNHSTTTSIRSVLLVKKPNDDRTTQAAAEIIRYLAKQDEFPRPRIIVERNAIEDLKAAGVGVGIDPTGGGLQLDVLDTPSPTVPRIAGGEDPTCPVPAASGTNPPPEVDLVVTLGGDGTILHVSSLYARAGVVPPVVSFSMGSLGFLLPFHIEGYRKTLSDIWRRKFAVLPRMRLACQVFDAHGRVVDRCAGAGSGWQVMNEVALHRGRYPHLSVVDAFVNDQHLTEAVADGLILATPTGSTAYSLSSGGPIAHPSINSFLLTPIAPRSLSFRTLLLPDDCQVKMQGQISTKSRAPSELSMDGREVCVLHPGEYITLRKSSYPMPCIVPQNGKDGWVADINSLLQFNVGFKNSALWRGHTSG